VAGDLLYFVMPYVGGKSLRQRLAREKQLPVPDALRIAREVADALDYAHRQGVVHRDIKPENILLQEQHAVLADFGIAWAVVAAGGEKLTATGVVIGTPAYMSPEQAGGSRDLDGRSDVYSLGCVVYEMLAGQAPFIGPIPSSLIHQHLSVPPRPVTDLRPSVPAPIVSAIQRALAKAASDRFRTAAEFVAAIANVGPEPPNSRATAHVTATHRPSIAVLPFQNMSTEAAHTYFAGGLHDELLTQLAKVAGLKVISRTSVMGYKDTTKPLRMIGQELGVASIVEGSVQVVGGRLRVNVQLIDAATDEHIWAERYDRTIDDAFAIQSDMAQQVVAAVGAALGADERRSIGAEPTGNAEAYLFYLQGEAYRLRPGVIRQNFVTAQQFYERALALDPEFALAHATLSETHGVLYFQRFDPTVERAALQREAAEKAVRLAPELPQAHRAMGLAYYWGEQDYRKALQEFEIALRGTPNDAELWFIIGAVQRRLGNWKGVRAAFERATQLDPRSADVFGDLGGLTLGFLRQYDEAARALDRSLALSSDAWEVDKAWMYVLWKGALDELQSYLERVPPGADLGGIGPARRWQAELLLLQRRSEALLAVVRDAPDAVFHGQYFYTPACLYSAWAHALRGDGAAARAAYGAALELLDSAMPDLSDDWRIHESRGLALAGLGRSHDALREVDWMRGTKIYRLDAFSGPQVAARCALILAHAGESNAALDKIERDLSGPGYLSAHLLRLDPRWDPIREHPRFKALLVKYANPELSAPTAIPS
jgi:serine/threonine-protein kinase